MGRSQQTVRIRLLETEMMRSKRGVSLREFAEKHGFNERTVYRDLKAIEDMGIPVIQDDNRYRIEEKALCAPNVSFTAEELAALDIARKLTREHKHTSVGRALDSLWAKLHSAANETAVPSVFKSPAPEMPVQWTIAPPAVPDLGDLHRIVNSLEIAIRETRPIAVEYRGLRNETSTTRVIEPMGMHSEPRLGGVYVIAWCRLRDAVRVFALQRFSSAKLLEETFAPRETLRSKNALASAFRVWREDNVEEVRIRLRGYAARMVMERKFHPTQQITKLGGASEGTTKLSEDMVDMTLHVPVSGELECWLLQFGEHATVLAPDHLASRIANVHRRASSQYVLSRASREHYVGALERRVDMFRTVRATGPVRKRKTRATVQSKGKTAD